MYYENLPVEPLACARYGPPDAQHSSAKTAQWSTSDHGRLLVERVAPYRWHFADGLTGSGAYLWQRRVEEDRTARRGPAVSAPPAAPESRPAFRVPAAHPAAWEAAARYLAQRGIDAAIWTRAHAGGQVWAHFYGDGVPYLVFPLRAAGSGRIIGALERCAGTPAQQQQQATFGLKRAVRGSDVIRGVWQLDRRLFDPAALIMVEAPIDGLALASRLTRSGTAAPYVIRATGGSACNPVQLTGSWTRVYAAFDNDAAGDQFAQQVTRWLTATGTPVQRIVPPAGHKDWAAAEAARQMTAPDPEAARER
ncbi:MAG: toprim domain-containing protein [Firmicutes bacterium]|nr:toprim domain-containing protein [Bacillota bacterium]